MEEEIKIAKHFQENIKVLIERVRIEQNMGYARSFYE